MKKIMILGLVLLLVFSMAACQKQTVETPEDQTPTPQDPPQNVVVDPSPEGEKEEITIYYINNEYIATGDESLEKAIPVTKEVVIGEKAIEEVILEELQKEPEDEKLSTAIGNIKVLSVETAENTAFVNLSGEKLSGGSLDETMILTQLILSLTELPGIEQIQIYVDGRVRETLMSHYEIMEPLTREDIGY